ncbi:hypothetical protein [Saccharothrix sp.]|uniref:hypothetical protein n=1 Tax=Saccharothrix sp. TaxID=1873460 RepID=UPI0028121DAA|nr:hypothetical protein [Saccharothrix sp.]
MFAGASIGLLTGLFFDLATGLASGIVSGIVFGVPLALLGEEPSVGHAVRGDRRATLVQDIRQLASFGGPLSLLLMVLGAVLGLVVGAAVGVVADASLVDTILRAVLTGVVLGALLLTAQRRARSATETYAALVEATALLHTTTLATALSLEHTGPPDRETGWTVTCLLQGRPDLIPFTPEDRFPSLGVAERPLPGEADVRAGRGGDCRRSTGFVGRISAVCRRAVGLMVCAG